MLRALEAQRFVQPERVVVAVGDDDEARSTVIGGGTARGLNHEARANPPTPKGRGGINGLVTSAAGGRDNPAATNDRSRRTVESDVPRAAPCAKEGAEVVESLAAESAVRVLFMPCIPSVDLQLNHRVPELHIGAVGRVECPDLDLAALARVRLQLSGTSDQSNVLVEVVAPIDELAPRGPNVGLGQTPAERAMAHARLVTEYVLE